MDKTILCFETGGTKLVAAMFDGEARVLDRRVLRRPPGNTGADTVELLSRAGKELSGRLGAPAAIGWGFGGTVDRAGGNPLYCYHEAGWGSFNAPARLQREFGDIPVFVENDCNLAALAEAWVGRSGHPPEMLFFTTLGTGIGGGIVRRGELQQFSREGEGEIGHLVVEPDGLPCACGNRGCLEVYCSGPGMRNLSRLVLGKDLDSREIMEGFRAGDPGAVRVVERAADYLGRAFSAVITILAPEEIVLGGGLMWKNEKFLRLIETRSRALAFPVLREKVRFRLSELGEDLVCRGACLFALQNLSRLQK